MGVIYKATNLINGKSYVGMTSVGFKQRYNRHIFDMRHGSNLPFHRALRKYGEEMFEWEIIDNIDDFNMLNKFETFNIQRYNTKVPNGYNLTDGGDGKRGFKVSDKTKIKQSITMMGHKVSDETRRKISLSKGGDGILKEEYPKYKPSYIFYDNNKNPERKCWRIRIVNNDIKFSSGYFEDPLSAEIIRDIILKEV